jgi:hypothetical protein
LAVVIAVGCLAVTIWLAGTRGGLSVLVLLVWHAGLATLRPRMTAFRISVAGLKGCAWRRIAVAVLTVIHVYLFFDARQGRRVAVALRPTRPYPSLQALIYFNRALC